MAESEFIPRKAALSELRSFVAKPGSGFTFLRGRRRVGKTWLLKKFQLESESCFYFMGLEDADDSRTKKAFAEAWQRFSNSNSLLELAPEYRSWLRIFEEVKNFASKLENRSLIIVLDEIQWIAKKNSGVISFLKQAWVDWQRQGNIKVIICGSSNKFFNQNTSGADDILRGIKTSGSIYLREFSLKEIEKYYLSSWSRSEICLTYMMLGGSPYYLETIEPQKGFIHAINDAIFTKGTIFLEEVDQVLKLECNARGLVNVKKILANTAQQGSSKQSLQRKTGLALSTVSDVVDKLVEYKILFSKLLLGNKNMRQNSVTRYYLRDFYLNFYFHVLLSFSEIISNNKDQLIFTSKSLLSENGYYIPNFSGHAFELLCERALQFEDSTLKNKLNLKSNAFNIGAYWDNQGEIDLIVEDSNDRISRVVECKWVDKNSKFKSHLQELSEKKYDQAASYSIQKFLIAAYNISEKQKENAEALGVIALSTDDLF